MVGDADNTVTVLLPLDREVTVTAAEAGAEISAIDAAVAAYNYGQRKHFSNLVIYVKCFFGTHEVELAVHADEAVIRDKVEEAVAEVKAGLMTSVYGDRRGLGFCY
jgi:6-phosphogluconate dehydrogenase